MKNKTRKSVKISKVIKGAGWSIVTAMAAKAVMKKLNPPQKLNLRYKVVLITGGSRGLGLILARKLAKHGAVIAICSRSEEALQRATADLATKAGKCLAIPCDITDKEQVREMVQEIKRQAGDIDILINNAGIIKSGPAGVMIQSDYEESMNTHFWGPLYLTDEVLPGMIKKRKGNIVNIASIGSKISFPHLLPYNVSKYALAGFSEGLTAELQKYNIKVTTVYPGLMRTGSPRNIEVKGEHQKEYAWFKLLDSLPLISMNADRAADKIIEALRTERSTLTLSVPAKIAVAVHGIAPGFTINTLKFIDSLLPHKVDNKTAKKGFESESKISASFLTAKTDEAARKNLEM